MIHLGETSRNTVILAKPSVAGQTIPAFGLAEIISVEPGPEGTVFNVRIPTGASLSNIAINGPHPLTTGQKGYMYIAGVAACLYPSGTTPSAGGAVGSAASTCTPASGNSGLIYLGTTVAGDSGMSVAIVKIGSAGTSFSKLLCRFTLNDAMTTSDATNPATITAQYGPGDAHSSTSITVYNLAKASGYVFSGASGAAGLAFWDSGTSWRIIQMECP